ncbi:MAG TPA: hypothetical protein VGV57_10920 [Thermoleophilaceae bacterium]|nr:hypothetical protein [Thermoleophilaceae bacterium]
MAAGVNFNNVWAALGELVSVFAYRPDEGHHVGGSDASGGRENRHFAMISMLVGEAEGLGKAVEGPGGIRAEVDG